MARKQQWRVGELRIPTTHHSAVRRVFPDRTATNRGEGMRALTGVPAFIDGWASCQHMTITEQLAAGVRAFDVRVMTRDDGEIVVAHTFQTDVLLRDVVDDMLRFVGTHPSEKILLFLRTEESKNGTVSGDGLRALFGDDRIDASHILHDANTPACSGPIASCRVEDLKPVTVVGGSHMEGDCPQQHRATGLRIVPCHIVPTVGHVVAGVVGIYVAVITGIAALVAVTAVVRSSQWRPWAVVGAVLLAVASSVAALITTPVLPLNLRALNAGAAATRIERIDKRSDGNHGLFMCDFIDPAVIRMILR